MLKHENQVDESSDSKRARLTEKEDNEAPASSTTDATAVKPTAKPANSNSNSSNKNVSEFLQHPDLVLCVAGLKGMNHIPLTKVVKTGVHYQSIRKVKELDWGLISFRYELQRKAMQHFLRGKRVEGLQLKVCERVPERVWEEEKLISAKERVPTLDPIDDKDLWSLSLVDDVRYAVSPLFDVPYEEQLEIKRMELECSLRKMTRLFVKKQLGGETKLSWIQQAGSDTCCPLEGVLKSPKTTEYRNKTEYTIGTDGNGELSVGFLMGRFVDGVVAVIPPTDCPGITPEAKEIAKLAQDVLRKSGLAPWDKTAHSGVWRRLMVRTSSYNEGLVELQVNPKGAPREEWMKTVNELASVLKDYRSAHSGVTATTFYLQEWDGVCNAAAEDSPRTLLFGNGTIYESILGIRLRVSPSSFFQVNTGAAEVLCSLLRDWSQADANTVVLDICCGTGNIGLPMAKSVGKVVGLELCQQAVQDAIENAKANGVDNAEYLCGRAENTINEAIQKYVGEGMKVVGIVDPPREGLHPTVIKALRKCTALHKLIYVSCNHVAWVEDAMQLCAVNSTKAKNTAPFAPIKAVGVDLFPSTHLVELVVLFEHLKL